MSPLRWPLLTLLLFVADVKPSNVLINTQGQVKMCDFGISGYLVDSVAKTMDAGCKPYMAVSVAEQGIQCLTRSEPGGVGLSAVLNTWKHLLSKAPPTPVM